jgi:hypothetical protein
VVSGDCNTVPIGGGRLLLKVVHRLRHDMNPCKLHMPGRCIELMCGGDRWLQDPLLGDSLSGLITGTPAKDSSNGDEQPENVQDIQTRSFPLSLPFSSPLERWNADSASPASQVWHRSAPSSSPEPNMRTLYFNLAGNFSVQTIKSVPSSTTHAPQAQVSHSCEQR